MKILHTVATLDPASGGPARSVPQLARALALAGYEVGLWAPKAVERLSDSVVEENSRLLVFADEFAAALDAFGTPDLVHDHGIWLPCHREVTKVCKARGIPRVVSPRGMLEPWALNHKKWKKRVAWWLYQQADLRSAAALHATAAPEAAQLRKLGLSLPIILAANGVDLPQVSDKAPDTRQQAPGIDLKARKIALFLSRIHAQKGLPMLLEAWAKVRPDGWGLRIVGPDEGGHVAELKARCDRLGLGWSAAPAPLAEHEARSTNKQTIIFSGPVEGDAKWQAFQEADLFILPTYSENFGIAVAEALACGVPVITTKGAPWEGLVTRRCGWWTDTSTAGIADALHDACTMDATTLEEMGHRGREWMRRDFSWQGIAARMTAAYEWVLGGGERPAGVMEP